MRQLAYEATHFRGNSLLRQLAYEATHFRGNSLLRQHAFEATRFRGNSLLRQLAFEATHFQENSLSKTLDSFWGNETPCCSRFGLHSSTSMQLGQSQIVPFHSSWNPLPKGGSSGGSLKDNTRGSIFIKNSLLKFYFNLFIQASFRYFNLVNLLTIYLQKFL
jgi:hypothetical protein